MKAAISEILAAIETARLPQAIELARQALDRGLQHSLLLNLRAFWLEQQNRDDEALADLLRAESLSPDDVPVLNALGLQFIKMERPGEAIEALDRALRLQPNFVPAYLNRGIAREATGEMDMARSDYALAISFEPRNTEALAFMAALAARTGDLANARSQAQRVLDHSPDHASANISLAQADLGAGALESAIDRLQKLLQSKVLSPFNRAFALSVMGDVYDALGAFADAFAAYSSGNEIFREIYAPRFEKNVAQSMPQYVEMLTSYFSDATTAKWEAAPGSAAEQAVRIKEHVFLVGFPRSGTTLLERILGSHPETVTIEERPTLSADMVQETLTSPQALDRLARMSDSKKDRMRQKYWRNIADAGYQVSNKVVIDKYPLNTLKLPLIAKLFPEAKIIFAVRDPRDVVLSCFRRRFRINPSMFEFLRLESAAHFYAQVMRLFQLYLERVPVHIHLHRYEDMIADFDRELRSLCGFIGLDWTEEMRLFASRSRLKTSATPSSSQVSRDLYDAAAGKWRDYKENILPVQPILRPWISHYSYSID